MKYILLFIIIIFGGCSYNKKYERDIHSLAPTNKTPPLLQHKEQSYKSQDISLNWTITSWINISWTYSTISNSWEELNYNNKFIINFLENSTKRSYNVTYSPIYSWYTERLWIENNKHSLSIKSHNLLDIKNMRWSNPLDKGLCTPHYEEWINYKPKTIEKTLWDKKIYITYATFDVSAPDTLPFKNYQAEICFVQDDKIYTITIGDTKQYRKDIVESFRFL